MPRLASVFQTASGCQPGGTYHFYVLTENAADLDVVPVAAAAYHQGIADAVLRAGFSATREAVGVYFCTLTTPTTYAYCDEMLVRLTITQGAVSQSAVWAAMVSNVAFDAAGGTLLQPSEHINEIPLDIASAFLQYTLAQYTNPAAPTTSALQMTGAALVNTPPSGGLTAAQVGILTGLQDQIALVPKNGVAAILTAGDETALTAAGSGSGVLAALRSAATITIPGTHTTSGSPLVLTHAQYETLMVSIAGGDDAATVPVASGTATETYYLIGQPRIPGNVVMVATVAYNAQGAQVNRTDLYTAPAPY